MLFWSGAVAFAKAGLGVAPILLWGSVTAAGGGGALLWFLRSWLSEPVTSPADRLLEMEWRYGAGVFVSQVSSLLTYHLDKLLVGALVSPAAAGIYAACSNMAAKLLAVIAVISTFSFPQAVALHAASDRSAIRQLFVRGSRVSMLLSLSFGVPAIVLASNFVRLWLGNDAATTFGAPEFDSSTAKTVNFEMGVTQPCGFRGDFRQKSCSGTLRKFHARLTCIYVVLLSRHVPQDHPLRAAPIFATGRSLS